jgi:hypothetical protein
MDKGSAGMGPLFTQPLRQIALMLFALGLVAFGAWVGRGIIAGVFVVNLWLNAFIAFVFALGVLTCFAQMGALVRSVGWIKGFVARRPGYDGDSAPSLLAPLAALLAHRAARMQISPISQRSILDSVATRLDETRDLTRYLGNLLIFLGLLGTFYGLATTVPAMVATIQNLAPQEGESGTQVFAKLMAGLEEQLGGIGTAFASSLFGLAGSLVIGLIDLFAGHGQNRFYRELEEWLSTITRVGLSPGEAEGEGGGGGYTEQLVEAIETLAAQIAAQAAAIAERDAAQANTMAVLAGRTAAAESRLADLAAALARFAPPDPAPQLALLERIAKAQEGAAAEGGADAENRMRLRSIDVQLLRILEEIAAGRQESMADLRADITTLTNAVRQLGRGGGGGAPGSH